VEGAERKGHYGPPTFGLIAVGCGFATNSIVSEMRRGSGLRPAAARIFASRPVQTRGWSPIAWGCGAAIAKVAIRPLCWGPIAALRLHLPSGPEAFWVLLALSDETR
jgi:hypothetical protein